MADYDGKIVIGTEVDLSGAKKGLSELKTTADSAGKNLGGLGDAFNGASTQGAAFGGGLGKLAGQLGIATSAVALAGKAAREFVEFMVDCTKASIEFESAITGVYKTVDASSEELAEITAGIKELAMEIPATTTEIASVAEAAGQLGIAKEDILEFTETMLAMGTATNLSADEAASALAKFANITKMSAEDYDNLGSAIVDLGNNFATTEADIVNMTTRLAATAEVAGFSEAEMLALSTALSSVGMEAEAGGSAMGKLIKEMQSSANGGRTARRELQKTGYSLRELELLADADSKAFKELAQSMGYTSKEFKDMLSQAQNLEKFAEVAGMTADGFAKMWNEAPIEAMNAFLNGLGQIDEEGGDALAILDSLGMTEIRLSNAVLALASSEGVLTDALITANKAWEENNALSKEAEKRADTLESKTIMLANAWERVKVAIGDIYSDELKFGATVGTDALEWVAKLLEEDGEEIIEAIRTYGSVFTEIYYELGTGSAGTGLQGGIGKFGGFVAVDILEWATKLLVDSERKKTMGKEAERAAKESTRGSARQQEEKAKKRAEEQKKEWEEKISTFDRDISTFDRITAAVTTDVLTLEQSIGRFGLTLEDYGDMLESFAVATTSAFGRLETGADSVLSLDQIMANLTANQNTMKTWGENFDKLIEKMMNFEGGQLVIEQFREMGVEGAAQLAKLLQSSDKELEAFAKKMQEGQDLAFEVTANVSGEDALSEIDKFKNQVKEKLAELQELYRSGMLTDEQLEELSKPLLDSLGLNVEKQLEEQKEKLMTKLEFFKTQLAAGMITEEQFKEMARPIYNEIANVENELKDIEGAATAEVEKAIEASKAAAEQSKDVGTAMAEGIKKGIEENSDEVSKTMVKVVTDAIGAGREALQIRSPSKTAEEKIGKWIMPGIAEGILESSKEAVAAMRSVMGQLIDGGASAIDTRKYTDLVENAKASAYTAVGHSIGMGGDSYDSHEYHGSQTINFFTKTESPGEIARKLKAVQKQQAIAFSFA